MTEIPEDQSGSASREVGARVLNAMAAASLVAGLTAFMVMLVSWLASGQDNAPREWPSIGWLICVPALAAAVVLVSTAESLRKPGAKTRDAQSGVSPTPPAGDHGPA